MSNEYSAVDLTEDDRRDIDRLLGSPLDFPDEFKKWILDAGALNIPAIPIDHLQGYVPTRIEGDDVATSQATSSTTYVELATQGPVVTNLRDGKYLVMHGCRVSVTYGRMSLSYNGSTPTDADSVYVETGGGVTYMGARLKEVTLANDDNNEIRAYYRKDSSGGAGSATFRNRWMSVLRIA